VRAKRIAGCLFSVLFRDNVSGVLHGVIDRHPIVQIDLQCLQKGPTRETCLVVTRMVAEDRTLENPANYLSEP
jgi:hypothetical protein